MIITILSFEFFVHFIINLKVFRVRQNLSIVLVQIVESFNNEIGSIFKYGDVMKF